MRKTNVTIAASLALAIGISTTASYKSNSLQNNTTFANLPISENKTIEQSTAAALDTQVVDQINPQVQAQTATGNDIKAPAEVRPVDNASTAKAPATTKDTSSKTTSSAEKKASIVAKADSKPKQSLSRGGSGISSQNTTYTGSSKNGELLSWSKASSLIPNGSTVRVTDLTTGKTFSIKRTFGTNHLDGEAKSSADTNTIKSIWGGFSWARRSVIVSINGREIAASMTAMPHAGVDSAPALKTVSNRSDGYGTGENLDTVKSNGMDGVIDIHFLNSTRHKDNRPDPQHQAAILAAAGK